MMTGTGDRLLPRVFVLDPQALAGVKAKIASGSQEYAAALARLTAEADAALGVGPFSVVNKPLTPPSGDRHDYMSLARYYWPNPHTPNGLPYVERDGEVNPEIWTVADHKDFDALMAAVFTLGLAFYFADHARYAEHAARLLRVWFLDLETRMNPNLEFAQGIRGVNDGRGTGLIETRELAELVDGIGLLAGSPAWTPADQQGLVQWCSQFLGWLVRSQHGQDEGRARNNHGTFHEAQVAALALFVGQDDLARQVLHHSMTSRIAYQIEPDGRQPLELARTLSWHYCVFNLQALFRQAALGERVGLDIWHYQTADGRSLRKALDFLAPYATGADWPYKEIGHRDYNVLYALMRLGAVHFHDESYVQVSRQMPCENSASLRVHLTLPSLSMFKP